MHELSLAQEVINMARESVGNRKPALIEVEIGTLSGIVPESLDFCLASLAEDEWGDPVTIKINKEVAEAKCSCGELYLLKTTFSPCPTCGSFEKKIISGRDFRLISIEVKE